MSQRSWTTSVARTATPRWPPVCFFAKSSLVDIVTCVCLPTRPVPCVCTVSSVLRVLPAVACWSEPCLLAWWLLRPPPVLT